MKLAALDVDLSFVWALEISLDLDPDFTANLLQLMADEVVSAQAPDRPALTAW